MVNRIVLIFVLLLSPAMVFATVTSTATSATFTCSGSTGPFPFTFPISTSAAMTVTQNGTILSTSAYTIVPVNNNYANGGSVTLNTACPAGQTIVLTRDTPITQLTQYTPYMPAFPENVESSLDKLTEITQEQNAEIAAASNGFPAGCAFATFLSIPCGGTGSSTPAGALANLGNELWSAPGDTLVSIEAACALKAGGNCTYNVTTTQTITISGNVTLPAGLNLIFRSPGMWTVNGSGYTLTIPANVIGDLQQHFAGTAAIKFGASQALAPVEWFGAIGDWNGATGTDNTAAIQATINALTSGQALIQGLSYEVTSALLIQHSSVGIKGTVPCEPVPSLGVPACVGTSQIITTSASADILVLNGPGNAILTENKLEDFTVTRSVAPTGSPNGIYLNYVWIPLINNVVSVDSIYDWHLHGVGIGIGHIDDSAAIGTSLTQSVNWYGWYIDSEDGEFNPSTKLNSDITFGPFFVASPTNTSIGMFVEGTQISDLFVDNFETAQLTIGVKINYTGTQIGGHAGDIHFHHTTNDGFTQSGFLITNLGTIGNVDISDGWEAGRPNTGVVRSIDIENSYGVSVKGETFGRHGCDQEDRRVFRHQ